MYSIDLAVIAIYLVGCTFLGARIGGASASKGLKGYLLGERNIPGWAVMISIVATETSAVTFLSVPGTAYKGNLTFLQLAFGYILARIVVALVLLPAYFRNEIYTAYQVLERRFGVGTQRAASVLFLVSRTLASGLRLLLAAEVLAVITGWDVRALIVLVGLATLLYTYLGGLSAVVWTDVLQFFVYLTSAAIACVIILREIPGGWATVWAQGNAAGKFRVIDLGTDGLATPAGLGAVGPWLMAILSKPHTIWAGVIGGLVLDTGTHGADQMMVQRYLSARSRRQAGWALVASGFLILAQFALFLTIGVGLWVLYRGETIGRDAEFARFIKEYFPTGLFGLVVAAILSVTMSTVSGAISASASSTVNDLYRPLFPATDDRRLVRLSKGLTGFWGLVQIGVAVAAVGLQDSVVHNALSIASFVMGPLLGVFLLGLWTRSVGQSAAFVGMLAGIAANSAVAFGTKVAYPWWSLVGSATVVGVALAVSPFLPVAGRSPEAPS